MIRFLGIFILIANQSFAQKKILFYGNYQAVELGINGFDKIKCSSLPTDLDGFEGIFIFSQAHSTWTEADLNRLILHIENGAALYLGADDWPLQAEANVLTSLLYNLRFYPERASTSFHENGNEINNTNSQAFLPIHPQLQNMEWLNDHPVLLRGQLGKGKIVIDCRYARFYGTKTPNKEHEWQFVTGLMGLTVHPLK